MQRHLIIGASGGIGSAMAQALPGEVVSLSRSSDGLDICDEPSIAHHLGRQKGRFDTIIVTTGALVVNGAQPEKTLRSVSPDAVIDQFRVNAIGPALILKHALHLLYADRRSVFAALSARVGSIGDNHIGGWYSYRSAKAALNQMIHTAAIELSRTHKHTIAVCLHPGTVQTPFTAAYAGRHKMTSPKNAAEQLISVIDNLSLQDSGKFLDYSGQEIAW
ncbi:MAG: SDR family NAD(P)-dependent oxidoreductase [Pseudomonadota bacterium]